MFMVMYQPTYVSKYLNMSTVVAVQTRGCDSMSFWTMQYRLELSQNCVTFNPLLDHAGINVVKKF